MIDIAGQRFGRLVVLESTKRIRIPKILFWRCQCDCGNITFVNGWNLRNRKTKSCDPCARKLAGAKKRIDITNKRFGRLVAKKYDESRESGPSWWICQCDCGNTASVRKVSLTRGTTRSCGCLAKEIAAKTCKRFRRDITGLRSGRLTAIEPTNEVGGTSRVWRCQCDCGNITFVSCTSLTREQNIKSCGCLSDATRFAKGTKIDPMNVPFEITNYMKAIRGLKKAIKQAS